MKPRRVLVVYYSQTGQLRKIIDSVLSELRSQDMEIECLEIRPQPAFPFPWSSGQFFQAFPESFMGIPCRIEPVIPKYWNDTEQLIQHGHDLVLLGYSPWYLSPSIPMHAFLQTVEAHELLKGKPVITIVGCRNMWLMAQEKIKLYLENLDAQLVGNIVLRDKASNLVSVVTIIRWMFKGRQAKSGLFPDAGVSPKDIESASRFGPLIKEAVHKNEYAGLQQKLLELGALEVRPNLILFERNGSRIFKMWASKILKKGPLGDKRRTGWLRIFKYYLLAVLFLVTPVANLFYAFIKLFISKRIKKDIRYFSHNSLPNEN
jgi:hypothetical protein